MGDRAVRTPGSELMKNGTIRGEFVALGMAFGAAIGLALHNLALGIGIGLSLGVGLSGAMRKKSDDDPGR